MRQPHVWAVERTIETGERRVFRRPRMTPWAELYSGDEVGARTAFTDAEVAAMTGATGWAYDELKLWHGEELILHVWHNR